MGESDICFAAGTESADEANQHSKWHSDLDGETMHPTALEHTLRNLCVVAMTAHIIPTALFFSPERSAAKVSSNRQEKEKVQERQPKECRHYKRADSPKVGRSNGHSRSSGA